MYLIVPTYIYIRTYLYTHAYKRAKYLTKNQQVLRKQFRLSFLVLNVAVSFAIIAFFCIKLFTSLLISPQNVFFVDFSSNLVLRHHPYQINFSLPHTDVLKIFFRYSSVKTSNSLPFLVLQFT